MFPMFVKQNVSAGSKFSADYTAMQDRFTSYPEDVFLKLCFSSTNFMLYRQLGENMQITARDKDGG